MLFNSYIFIFVFLPLTLLGWYGLNRLGKYKTALCFLTAMSLWFYGYFNVSYLFLLLLSVGLNYGLSALLARAETRSARPVSPGLRRCFLLLTLFVNLGIFFYFKYRDFFFENVNALFGTDFVLKGILLPLGISFFTFQQLSYGIDRAGGKSPHRPFLSYIAFVTFFPQLIAGPIVLYDELMPHFEDPALRVFDAARFAKGVRRFIIGLSKKVLLADVLAGPANYGFYFVYYMDAPATILMVLSYAFELYFDFSGYCDMAIGLGLMFGVDLPENFLSPYKAATIREFWQRWHVTLQRFFTRYVYIPLGGSRKGVARTMLNSLLVFSLSGLWHGAAWTYCLWGITNGLLIILDTCGLVGVAPAPDAKRPPRYFFRDKPLITIPRSLGRIGTFFLFLMTLIFFRAGSLGDALVLFKSLTRFTWPGYLFRTAEAFAPSEFYMVYKVAEMAFPAAKGAVAFVIWMGALLFSGWLVFACPSAKELLEKEPLTKTRAFIYAFLFVFSVLSLSQVSTFLYFNF